MSADDHQHDTPNSEPPANQQQELPKHPFTVALETWNAWSMADTMRRALQRAREHGDHETVARFERYPEWTQGPGPLEALRANRELVQTLTGWQWQAMRAAREQGRGWHEIAAALGLEADRTDLPAALACGADVAKRAYLGRSSGNSASRTACPRDCCATTPAGGSWPPTTPPTALTSTAGPRPDGRAAMSVAEHELPHRDLGDVDRQRPRLRDDLRRDPHPS